MIDLHTHLLPGIDDGPTSLDTAIEMARLWRADGVTTVACTPHILPGLYANTGPGIINAMAELQLALAFKGIDLKLVAGADNHIVGDFITGLKSGRLLTLAGSRYVLIEPPHHVCPPRLEQFFFDIIIGGYVPILTHPERLTWIEGNYEKIAGLARAGVWMQLTAGSLIGQFGRRPKYWAERLLDEGLTALLASDAHDDNVRRPNLRSGFEVAARRMGDVAAMHLVQTRPEGILDNLSPKDMPMPAGVAPKEGGQDGATPAIAGGHSGDPRDRAGGWLRNVFKS